MREKLTSRVGRIISGSFNALIDAIENTAPETVMEEAIREIDGAVDELRAELGLVMANKHLANTRLMEANQKIEALTENIALAIKSGRGDLAETAVSQQLDLETQVPVLEAAIRDGNLQENEMEGYIKALRAKKREMQQDLREFRKSRGETSFAGPSDTAASAGAGGAGLETRVEKAASAFDRVLEKTSGLPAGVGGGDRKSASQMAELEAMAHKNRIQERLAAIKSNMEDQ